MNMKSAWKSTTFALFVFAIIELNPVDFVIMWMVYVMWNLMWNFVYVKLDMMCWCYSVELLPNDCGYEKYKPEIITSRVYHLMYASNLVLVCGKQTFAICQTLVTYGPRKEFFRELSNTSIHHNYYHSLCIEVIGWTMKWRPIFHHYEPSFNKQLWTVPPSENEAQSHSKVHHELLITSNWQLCANMVAYYQKLLFIIPAVICEVWTSQWPGRVLWTSALLAAAPQKILARLCVAGCFFTIRQLDAWCSG